CCGRVASRLAVFRPTVRTTECFEEAGGLALFRNLHLVSLPPFLVARRLPISAMSGRLVDATIRMVFRPRLRDKWTAIRELSM
ncbi:hypothetical protein PspLS_07668, partial [Pyricularia sp. CBS 133598]